VERRSEREQQRREAATPDQAATPAPQAAPAASILALQQSAGNHAVSQALSAQVARDPFSWAKKKLKGKPKVGKPENARPMKPEEQNGVLSMKQLIEVYENTLLKVGDKQQAGLSDETVGALGGLAGTAEQKAGFLESIAGAVTDAVGGGEKDGGKDTAPPQGEQESEADDPFAGISDLFEAAEALWEEAWERDRQADEQLYQQCKSASALMDILGPGFWAEPSYRVLQAAVKAWRTNSRRSWNLPEDKPRRQELEALLEEKKWLLDKDKVDAAVIQPDPELKADDKDGFFIAKTVDLFLVKPDGSLDTAAAHFNADQMIVASRLVPLNKGGKDGYTISFGPKTYWMDKANVVVKTGGHEKVDAPLWPPDPSPDHVKQTTLGDCYLQASVASLADKNPGLIKAMMRDNGDDTVTVRLYEVDETDQTNHKFTAKYVRINKSVPKNFQGQDVYNAGSLWVRLIEKAYAAGGFTGTGAAAPPKKDYQSIAAGFARYAMEVLTGQQMKENLLTGGGPDMQSDGSYASWGESTGTRGGTVWANKNASTVPWDANEVTAHGVAKAADQYDNLLSFKILKDKGLVDTWITFVKTDAIKNMFTKRQTDRAAGFAGDITLTDFATAMAGLAGGVKDPILAWLEQQKLYPGELGTAKYSQFQLDIFKKIKDTLAAGGMVTGGTWKYPGATATPGTGVSGGEVQHKGIVGGHAFSFIGARSHSTANPDDAAYGEFYFVKIRNPWASYGREYDMSQGKDAGKAVEGGTGVSWLELSDVTRYFDSINYG
jgi:hypothetical protein